MATRKYRRHMEKDREAKRIEREILDTIIKYPGGTHGYGTGYKAVPVEFYRGLSTATRNLHKIATARRQTTNAGRRIVNLYTNFLGSLSTPHKRPVSYRARIKAR
jgi:hypothetical protein